MSFSAFAGIEKMSNDKRTVLYRVAQAALINTAHACARQHGQHVEIKDLPQAVLMLVQDDGRSFDVAHVLDSRRNKRLGLIGMRERVEMVEDLLDRVHSGARDRNFRPDSFQTTQPELNP